MKCDSTTGSELPIAAAHSEGYTYVNNVRRHSWKLHHMGAGALSVYVEGIRAWPRTFPSRRSWSFECARRSVMKPVGDGAYAERAAVTPAMGRGGGGGGVNLLRPVGCLS